MLDKIRYCAYHIFLFTVFFLTHYINTAYAGYTIEAEGTEFALSAIDMKVLATHSQTLQNYFENEDRCFKKFPIYGLTQSDIENTIRYCTAQNFIKELDNQKLCTLAKSIELLEVDDQKILDEIYDRLGKADDPLYILYTQDSWSTLSHNIKATIRNKLVESLLKKLEQPPHIIATTINGWPSKSLGRLLHTLSRPGFESLSIAIPPVFSADGKLLAAPVSVDDTRIAIFDSRTLERITTLKQSAHCQSFAFRIKSNTFVGVNREKTRVWDLSTNKLIKTIANGYDYIISNNEDICYAIKPDKPENTPSIVLLDRDFNESVLVNNTVLDEMPSVFQRLKLAENETKLIAFHNTQAVDVFTIKPSGLTKEDTTVKEALLWNPYTKAFDSKSSLKQVLHHTTSSGLGVTAKILLLLSTVHQNVDLYKSYDLNELYFCYNGTISQKLSLNHFKTITSITISPTLDRIVLASEPGDLCLIDIKYAKLFGLVSQGNLSLETLSYIKSFIDKKMIALDSAQIQKIEDELGEKLENYGTPKNIKESYLLDKSRVNNFLKKYVFYNSLFVWSTTAILLGYNVLKASLENTH